MGMSFSGRELGINRCSTGDKEYWQLKKGEGGEGFTQDLAHQQQCLVLTRQSARSCILKELSKESMMVEHWPAGPPRKLSFLGLEWLPAVQQL